MSDEEQDSTWIIEDRPDGAINLSASNKQLL
jgi:hypothetical protein